MTRRLDGQVFYLIGEVAKSAGVSAQTLRVWEKQGLISPRRSSGEHRLYDDAAMQRAKQVAAMRRRHGWNPAAIRSSAAFEVRSDDVRDPALGARVRKLRRQSGLSQKELADRVGISRQHLSALERGQGSISFDLLSRVASAFDIAMSEFAEPGAISRLIVRADQRSRSVLAGSVVWDELATPRHRMEPAHVIVPPGAGSGGGYGRPGEIFAYVLEGRLEFAVDGQEHHLSTGDAITVPPGVDWSWRNPGDRDARVIYVEQVPADAVADPPTNGS